jgi:hypothetical protein
VVSVSALVWTLIIVGWCEQQAWCDAWSGASVPPSMRLVLSCLLIALARPVLGQATGASLPRTWIVGPTEGPSFCLILNDDHSGRFVGAFTRFNPVRWTYDSTKGELSLAYPRLDSATEQHFRYAAGKSFISFDTLTHTAVQNVVLGETIWFDGYTLFRRSALSPDEYAGAPQVCKVNDGS